MDDVVGLESGRAIEPVSGDVDAAVPLIAPASSAEAFEASASASIRRAAAVAGARNVCDAATVDLIADVLADESWDVSGIRSPVAWCRWQLGLSTSRATQLVRIAERRGELPGTFELFRAGQLSSDQVALIARHAPTSHEASVARVARHLTLTQLGRIVRAYHFGADESADPDVVPADAAGSLSLTTAESGRFVLRVEGDAEAGNRLRSALDQFGQKLRAEADDDDASTTAFAAFMELVDTATDHDPSRSRRDRSRAYVHVDLRDRGLIARAHLGPVLSDGLLRLITCDGFVQAVIHEAGTPLALGRSSRTVPDHLRRIVIDRDKGCVVCGRRRNLDAHHLHHWIDGGVTEPGNLVTLCSGCHQAHHRDEFDITGDPNRPDGITIRHPNGEPWRRSPRRPPPEPPEARFRNPSGERLRRANDVWFDTAPHEPDDLRLDVQLE